MVMLAPPVRGFALTYLLSYATASPTPANPVESAVAAIVNALTSGYAPTVAVCPASTPLVRAASGLSSGESSYISSRYAKASTALAAWLTKTDSTFDTSNLPVLALTNSGGGYRALLNGAGVIQGFDDRDSDVGTSGIYQGLTYQGGLSGGAWLLSSVAGNNWPTISSLKTGLWETAFQDSLLDPQQLLLAAAYAEIVDDIAAKDAAGYVPTIVDVYGRLLSYQLLYGTDGGVSDTLSGLTELSNFTSYNVPYPIMTARGANTSDGQCLAQDNGTQYEMHPYEWGSWDAGVHAFTPTKYLGSHLTNGSPTVTGVCTENYDNLGYILGTSSNVFADICSIIPAVNSTTNLDETLEALLARVTDEEVLRDIYAVYPNPYYQYNESSLVSAQTELDLTDGGLANPDGQNDPIWPFIQPARNVSVLIVADISADTTYNFPNGSEIYETYVQAQLQGLTKMPVIPPTDTFVADGLNTRATFFGCDDDNVITIVYLPNVAYSYASNTSTAQLIYSKAETDGIIANGVNIATQNGTAGWPTCLGCAIQKKTGTTLPSACIECFATYCYAG